eukprot:gene5749-4110_t
MYFPFNSKQLLFSIPAAQQQQQPQQQRRHGPPHASSSPPGQPVTSGGSPGPRADGTPQDLLHTLPTRDTAADNGPEALRRTRAATPQGLGSAPDVEPLATTAGRRKADAQEAVHRHAVAAKSCPLEAKGRHRRRHPPASPGGLLPALPPTPLLCRRRETTLVNRNANVSPACVLKLEAGPMCADYSPGLRLLLVGGVKEIALVRVQPAAGHGVQPQPAGASIGCGSGARTVFPASASASDPTRSPPTGVGSTTLIPLDFSRASERVIRQKVEHIAWYPSANEATFAYLDHKAVTIMMDVLQFRLEKEKKDLHPTPVTSPAGAPSGVSAPQAIGGGSPPPGGTAGGSGGVRDRSSGAGPAPSRTRGRENEEGTPPSQQSSPTQRGPASSPSPSPSPSSSGLPPPFLPSLGRLLQVPKTRKRLGAPYNVGSNANNSEGGSAHFNAITFQCGSLTPSHSMKVAENGCPPMGPTSSGSPTPSLTPTATAPLPSVFSNSTPVHGAPPLHAPHPRHSPAPSPGGSQQLLQAYFRSHDDAARRCGSSPPGPAELIEFTIPFSHVQVHRFVWDPHHPYTLAITSSLTSFELWEIPVRFATEKLVRERKKESQKTNNNNNNNNTNNNNGSSSGNSHVGLTAPSAVLEDLEEEVCMRVYPPRLVMRPPVLSSKRSHTAKPQDIAFSPSNPYWIAVISEDVGSAGDVRIFDTRHLKDPPLTIPLKGAGLSVAFHPLFRDVLAVCYRNDLTNSTTVNSTLEFWEMEARQKRKKKGKAKAPHTHLPSTEVVAGVGGGGAMDSILTRRPEKDFFNGSASKAKEQETSSAKVGRSRPSIVSLVPLSSASPSSAGGGDVSSSSSSFTSSSTSSLSSSLSSLHRDSSRLWASSDDDDESMEDGSSSTSGGETSSSSVPVRERHHAGSSSAALEGQTGQRGPWRRRSADTALLQPTAVQRHRVPPPEGYPAAQSLRLQRHFMPPITSSFACFAAFRWRPPPKMDPISLSLLPPPPLKAAAHTPASASSAPQKDTANAIPPSSSFPPTPLAAPTPEAPPSLMITPTPWPLLSKQEYLLSQLWFATSFTDANAVVCVWDVLYRYGPILFLNFNTRVDSQLSATDAAARDAGSAETGPAGAAANAEGATTAAPGSPTAGKKDNNRGGGTLAGYTSAGGRERKDRGKGGPAAGDAPTNTHDGSPVRGGGGSSQSSANTSSKAPPAAARSPAASMGPQFRGRREVDRGAPVSVLWVDNMSLITVFRNGDVVFSSVLAEDNYEATPAPNGTTSATSSPPPPGVLMQQSGTKVEASKPSRAMCRRQPYITHTYTAVEVYGDRQEKKNAPAAPLATQANAPRPPSPPSVVVGDPVPPVRRQPAAGSGAPSTGAPPIGSHRKTEKFKSGGGGGGGGGGVGSGSASPPATGRSGAGGGRKEPSTAVPASHMVEPPPATSPLPMPAVRATGGVGLPPRSGPPSPLPPPLAGPTATSCPDAMAVTEVFAPVTHFPTMAIQTMPFGRYMVLQPTNYTFNPPASPRAAPVEGTRRRLAKAEGRIFSGTPLGPKQLGAEQQADSEVHRQRHKRTERGHDAVLGPPGFPLLTDPAFPVFEGIHDYYNRVMHQNAGVIFAEYLGAPLSAGLLRALQPGRWRDFRTAAITARLLAEQERGPALAESRGEEGKETVHAVGVNYVCYPHHVNVARDSLWLAEDPILAVVQGKHTLHLGFHFGDGEAEFSCGPRVIRHVYHPSTTPVALQLPTSVVPTTEAASSHLLGGDVQTPLFHAAHSPCTAAREGKYTAVPALPSTVVHLDSRRVGGAAAGGEKVCEVVVRSALPTPVSHLCCRRLGPLWRWLKHHETRVARRRDERLTAEEEAGAEWSVCGSGAAAVSGTDTMTPHLPRSKDRQHHEANDGWVRSPSRHVPHGLPPSHTVLLTRFAEVRPCLYSSVRQPRQAITTGVRALGTGGTLAPQVQLDPTVVLSESALGGSTLQYVERILAALPVCSASTLAAVRAAAAAAAAAASPMATTSCRPAGGIGGSYTEHQQESERFLAFAAEWDMGYTAALQLQRMRAAGAQRREMERVLRRQEKEMQRRSPLTYRHRHPLLHSSPERSGQWQRRSRSTPRSRHGVGPWEGGMRSSTFTPLRAASVQRALGIAMAAIASAPAGSPPSPDGSHPQQPQPLLSGANFDAWSQMASDLLDQTDAAEVEQLRGIEEAIDTFFASRMEHNAAVCREWVASSTQQLYKDLSAALREMLAAQQYQLFRGMAPSIPLPTEEDVRRVHQAHQLEVEQDGRGYWWTAAAHAWRSHVPGVILTFTVSQLEQASLVGDVQFCMTLYQLYCLWWKLRRAVVETFQERQSRRYKAFISFILMQLEAQDTEEAEEVRRLAQSRDAATRDKKIDELQNTKNSLNGAGGLDSSAATSTVLPSEAEEEEEVGEGPRLRTGPPMRRRRRQQLRQRQLQQRYAPRRDWFAGMFDGTASCPLLLTRTTTSTHGSTTTTAEGLPDGAEHDSYVVHRRRRRRNLASVSGSFEVYPGVDLDEDDEEGDTSDEDGEMDLHNERNAAASAGTAADRVLLHRGAGRRAAAGLEGDSSSSSTLRAGIASHGSPPGASSLNATTTPSDVFRKKSKARINQAKQQKHQPWPRAGSDPTVSSRSASPAPSDDSAEHRAEEEVLSRWIPTPGMPEQPPVVASSTPRVLFTYKDPNMYPIQTMREGEVGAARPTQQINTSPAPRGSATLTADAVGGTGSGSGSGATSVPSTAGAGQRTATPPRGAVAVAGGVAASALSVVTPALGQAEASRTPQTSTATSTAATSAASAMQEQPSDAPVTGSSGANAKEGAISSGALAASATHDDPEACTRPACTPAEWQMRAMQWLEHYVAQLQLLELFVPVNELYLTTQETVGACRVFRHATTDMSLEKEMPYVYCESCSKAGGPDGGSGAGGRAGAAQLRLGQLAAPAHAAAGGAKNVTLQPNKPAIQQHFLLYALDDGSPTSRLAKVITMALKDNPAGEDEEDAAAEEAGGWAEHFAILGSLGRRNLSQRSSPRRHRHHRIIPAQRSGEPPPPTPPQQQQLSPLLPSVPAEGAVQRASTILSSASSSSSAVVSYATHSGRSRSMDGSLSSSATSSNSTWNAASRSSSAASRSYFGSSSRSSSGENDTGVEGSLSRSWSAATDMDEEENTTQGGGALELVDRSIDSKHAQQQQQRDARVGTKFWIAPRVPAVFSGAIAAAAADAAEAGEGDSAGSGHDGPSRSGSDRHPGPSPTRKRSHSPPPPSSRQRVGHNPLYHSSGAGGRLGHPGNTSTFSDVRSLVAGATGSSFAPGGAARLARGVRGNMHSTASSSTRPMHRGSRGEGRSTAGRWSPQHRHSSHQGRRQRRQRCRVLEPNPPLENAICGTCWNPNAMSCVICHSLVEGIFVRFPACSHGGHRDHVKAWMGVANACPCCTAPLCQEATAEMVEEEIQRLLA